MSDLARKKHLKRWPAYLMRFLPLTSPDIPLPFQRGLKMLIIFLCVFHGIELLKVRIRVCITKSEDVFARPSALVCNNKKRAPSINFDSAKVRRKTHKNPLYRAYNRDYIGEREIDFQRVTLFHEYLVYFLRTRWHHASFLHVPFLLGKIFDIPQLLECFPFFLDSEFLGK